MMKKFWKITGGIVLVLVLIVAGVKLSGNGYLLKGVWATYLHGENSATINDAKYFDSHPIAAPHQPWQWPVHVDYNKQALSPRLQDILSKNQTVAFLIISNDSIMNEHYWEGYTDSSLSNSFSMAKSITTMLAQVAIQKGILKGWHQKVKELLPDLKGAHAGELELWHLSTMSSGLDWDEAYKDPFTVTAKAYYGDHVSDLMLTLPIKDKPGETFNYQSGNTELLGMCVMKASGKSLAELASEWLWKPMQAQHDAKWHTDEQGTELCYCCFNSDARDFARFGRMMLHHGNWNGTQILDSSFVDMATKGALAPYYGYSFWINESHGTKVFAQRGILGQYIISIPQYNAVVVRLGKHCMKQTYHAPEDFHVIVEEVLAMLRKQAV